MYVDSSTVTANIKTYTRHLLRESYRENGKVKQRTIANISKAAPEAAIPQVPFFPAVSRAKTMR